MRITHLQGAQMTTNVSRRHEASGFTCTPATSVRAPLHRFDHESDRHIPHLRCLFLLMRP